MDYGASSYRRFLDGDDNGIVEVIRDYKDGLILFLNRYVNNIHTAEELAEETFFRLVTKKPCFTARYSFKTWLYTIGRNTALNHLKHARKTVDLDDEAWQQLRSEEEELERSHIREEQRIQVHRALARIPTQYGSVLYLKFFEDLTNEQIGAVLHKSKRQVENLLYQGKKALKAQLEQEGFQHEDLSADG